MDSDVAKSIKLISANPQHMKDILRTMDFIIIKYFGFRLMNHWKQAIVHRQLFTRHSIQLYQRFATRDTTNLTTQKE